MCVKIKTGNLCLVLVTDIRKSPDKRIRGQQKYDGKQAAFLLQNMFPITEK